MGRRRFKKIILTYRPWYLYVVWGLSGAFFLLNVVWTGALINKPVALYYEGFILPTLTIKKQNEIITLQYALIQELKSQVNTLNTALILSRTENDNLKVAIKTGMESFLRRMTNQYLTLEVEGGKIYVISPNGTREIQ